MKAYDHWLYNEKGDYLKAGVTYDSSVLKVASGSVSFKEKSAFAVQKKKFVTNVRNIGDALYVHV